MMRAKEKGISTKAIAKEKEAFSKVVTKERGGGSLHVPNVLGLLVLWL